MARRTQTYIKMPWSGGINDSVDSGVIPDSDLVQADNVIFGVSGSRLKREGISYFDQLDVPAASSVTRSGTTITVQFAEDINGGLATSDIFFVGEKITVVTSDAEFDATNTPITAIPGTDQIQYEVGGTPTAASATLTSITRTASIVGMHDFWYYDSNSNEKVQNIIAVNSDAQISRYDINGNRTYLANASYAVSFTDAGDTVTLNNHGLVEGDIIGFSDIVTTTGISVDTLYYVGGSITTNTFQLAATRGGSALPLTNDGTGTAVSPLFTTGINSASFLTINERCVITLDGIENAPKIYEPQTSTTTVRAMLGAPPNAKFCALHQGRVWANDKEDRERLYYSSPFNPEKWSGYDDSGTLDIGFGDGDPDGINAIFPSFKGALFISKRKHIYRIDGVSPDDYSIITVTRGIGSVGHNSIAAVDMDDVAYVSYKGIHSIAATNNYGDFESAFLSNKIQNAFASWTAGRLKYTSAAYLPTLNSLFFSVASNIYDDNNQDSLWIFNTKYKEWHRWPDIQAKSLATFDDAGTQKLLIGGYSGRISETPNDSYVDYGTSAISYIIKSGSIYVDGNPNTVKAFKRIGFIFRPLGDYTFTATVKIDNHAAQPIAFSQVAGGDVLGTSVVLGTSTLATSNTLAPYMYSIDGYGRGMIIKVSQEAANQQVELYGIVVEWESADISQETIGSQDL